jgi:septum formation protein
MSQVGYAFVVDSADLDETILPGEGPEGHTARLAREKARVVAGRIDRGIVVAADTIVVVGDEILGKPADEADAVRMLTLLSGRMHRVVSGVAVLDAATGRLDVRNSITAVQFRVLERHEIMAYLSSGEAFDKAGAYGIQGRGALLVERIDGCYFNVVGLPLSLLGQMLADFGVFPGT